MKIAFLCGSFEEGRDGVGDYVRLLAYKLVEMGHEAGVVALNDRYVSESINTKLTNHNAELQVLRIPSVWADDQRYGSAKKWISEFNPDLISLQFVIFQYHPKGLPFGLSKQLEQLGGGYKWHIMFHEIWVGLSTDSSFKFRLWGAIQKTLIKAIIKKLRPSIIHTQSRLYQALLNKNGWIVNYLPLFSNIPVQLPNGIKKGSINGKANISFVLFGTIHPGAPVESLINEVFLYAEEKHIKVSLTIVGRCGSEEKLWVEKWISSGFQVTVLGEQPVDIISEILHKADIGISTSAYKMIEKSGTVAAMLKHDLPVLCVSKPWNPRGNLAIAPLKGIFEYKKGNFETFMNNLPQDWSQNDIVDTCKNLINDFASQLI